MPVVPPPVLLSNFLGATMHQEGSQTQLGHLLEDTCTRSLKMRMADGLRLAGSPRMTTDMRITAKHTTADGEADTLD